MKAVCTNHRRILASAVVAFLVAGSVLLPRAADAGSAIPPAPETRANTVPDAFREAAVPLGPTTTTASRPRKAKALAAKPWDFTLVAKSTTEPDGLRLFGSVSVGDNGDVVFVGIFDNFVQKLMRFRNGAVTEVALPDGVTLFNSVLLTPQGDIAFTGFCPGATSTCLLKTDGTVVPVSSSPKAPRFELNDGNGKWVLSEFLPGSVQRLQVTDGVTTSAPFDLVTSVSSPDGSIIRQLVGLTADGAYVIWEAVTTFGVDGITRIRLAGPRSDVLAEARFFSGPPGTGQEIQRPVGVGPPGELLFTISDFTADGTRTVRTEHLVLRSADGTFSAKADSNGPYAFFTNPMFLGPGQQPIFGAIPDAAPSEIHVFTGFDLAQDRLVAPFEELLGELGHPTISVFPAPAMKFLAVQGEAASRITRALFLASRPSDIRWNAPGGGAWAEAGNWTPEIVPGAGDRVRFGLDAAYPVDLGAAAAVRVQIEAGDVTWRSGALAIGVDGLSVAAADAGGTARLTIATPTPPGPRTRVTAANVVVGFVPGAGELTVDGASLNPPEGAESSIALMGFGAPATARVTNEGGWNWGSMSVGASSRSRLDVQDGAVVGAFADRLFVGGSGLAFPLSGETGTVVVTNETNKAGAFSLGTMLGPITEIVVGEALIGRLEVRDGALAWGGRMNLGTRDHGATTDAFLVVTGINDTEQARVQLGLSDGGGLFAATGAGTDAQVTVSDGGRMSVTRLSLADGAGSRAVMTVTGAVATPDGETLRSEVVAPIPPDDPGAPEAVNLDDGRCVVGNVGFGSLTVAGGGLVSCRTLAVGLLAGSRGSLRIDGLFGSTASRVVVRGPDPEVDGNVCIGRSPLCDGPLAGSVRGDTLIGADGVLEAQFVLVSAGGRISGTGVVIVDEGLEALDGGIIAPGIDVLGVDPDASGPIQRALASTPTGTLTVQGGVTFRPGSQLVLEVGGAAPGSFDALRVTGTATLGGQLTLNFVDGFLPRRGDTFRFVQAGSVVGDFASVVTTGLPEGYESPVSIQGGEVRLTFTCVPITLAPTSLAGGTRGTPYSQVLAAAGGIEPYGYAVTGGALPAGLTLSAAGTLAGTPTESGSFNFTVTATDPGPCAGSRAYTLTIAAGSAVASIASIAPSSGPASGGQIVTITGSGLAGATGVTFGGVAAAIRSRTDTVLTVTTPGRTPGVVDVVVTTPGGTATATAAYTYLSDAAAIPATSTLALILVAAALAGVALRRLR